MPGHDVVLGSGYRLSFEHYPGSRTATPRPDSHAHLVTAFAQDEIALTDSPRVTPGARIERNDDTGVEVQPSLRGLWAPTASQSVWAAASRAVRTPNRADRFSHIAVQVIPSPAPLPLVLTILGTPDFRSEVLKAYEVGYRFQRARFSIDGTLFVANYRGLLTVTEGEPRIGQELGATVLVLPLNLANAVGGQGRGAEVAAMVTLTDRWRVLANYSLLDVHVDSLGASGLNNGATPTHQWHVRTYLDLPYDLSLTGLFYRTSAFPEVQVAAYNRLDTRVAWTVRRRVELAVGLQNLLRDQTPEFRDVTAGSQPAPIHRTAYASATWRF